MRVNLLPKDERPLRQSQVRWEFLVGLIGVLFFGAVLLFSWVEVNRVEGLQYSYTEAQSREVLLQRQVQGVQDLRREVTALETKKKSYQDLFIHNVQAPSLIPNLTNHPFPKLWVEALIWTENKVELVGYTQEMTSLSQYLNYLNERSEQALLQAAYPREGTDFFVFSIQVKGVESNDATQFD
ncbi:MAG: hypothetical protein GX956_07500 [Firmicutes bacterium]|nr:hypothetical protein [Bacillota bacterium]